jgi:hypothetical protein
MLDLQAARRVVAAHERHDAVVGVSAGAQLSRQRRFLHGRIADHAAHTRLAIELVGEIVLLDAERQRHGAQHARREPHHGVVIGQHGRFEVMRLLRPDVRRVHLGARLVDLGRQVGAVVPEREGLLDVGRRRLAHRVGNRTIAEPVVAAADLGRRPRHLHLLFDRQREEIDRPLARPGDELGRNAVPGHHEEAGVHASGIDLARHLALLGRSAVAQWRQVDVGIASAAMGRAFRCAIALNYISIDSACNGTREEVPSINRRAALCQVGAAACAVLAPSAVRAQAPFPSRVWLARRDPPTLFDLVDEPFNQIARRVEMRTEA